MSTYRIDVCWYRDTKQLEAGQFERVAPSGFAGLTLEEAQVCRSKTSDEPHAGRKRYNRVTPRDGARAMSLFNKEQGARIRAHFKDPSNKMIRVQLHHHVDVSEVATVWRSDLEPFYYWVEVQHVPHKRARGVATTHEGRAFDTIEQLVKYYTHS